MFKKVFHVSLVVGVCLGSGLLGVNTFADNAGLRVKQSNKKSVKVQNTLSSNKKVNNYDLLDAFLFGKGRLVDSNPQILKPLKALNFANYNMKTGSKRVFEDEFINSNPGFYSEITRKIINTDPYEVKEGISNFSKATAKFINDKSEVRVSHNYKAGALTTTEVAERIGTTAKFTRNDWAWTKSNVVAVTNAVGMWQIAGFHTVAGAAEVAVVVTIVPGAATYVFTEHPEDIQMNNNMSKLTNFLGSLSYEV